MVVGIPIVLIVSFDESEDTVGTGVDEVVGFMEGVAFSIWTAVGACWNSPQRIYPTAQIGSPAGLERTYVQSTDRVHTRVI